MPTKHEATLPDGGIAKRVSQSRVYSHCVASRPIYAFALNRAKGGDESDRSTYRFYREFLDGTSRFLERHSYDEEKTNDAIWEARKALDVARMTEKLGGADVTEQQFVNAQRAARVAKVEAEKAAGRYERWTAYGWSSRADLARKAAAGVGAGYEVRVVEARIKEAR